MLKKLFKYFIKILITRICVTLLVIFFLSFVFLPFMACREFIFSLYTCVYLVGLGIFVNWCLVSYDFFGIYGMCVNDSIKKSTVNIILYLFSLYLDIFLIVFYFLFVIQFRMYLFVVCIFISAYIFIKIYVYFFFLYLLSEDVKCINRNFFSSALLRKKFLLINFVIVNIILFKYVDGTFIYGGLIGQKSIDFSFLKSNNVEYIIEFYKYIGEYPIYLKEFQEYMEQNFSDLQKIECQTQQLIDNRSSILEMKLTVVDNCIWLIYLFGGEYVLRYLAIYYYFDMRYRIYEDVIPRLPPDLVIRSRDHQMYYLRFGDEPLVSIPTVMLAAKRIHDYRSSGLSMDQINFLDEIED